MRLPRPLKPKAKRKVNRKGKVMSQFKVGQKVKVDLESVKINNRMPEIPKFFTEGREYEIIRLNESNVHWPITVRNDKGFYWDPHRNDIILIEEEEGKEEDMEKKIGDNLMVGMFIVYKDSDDPYCDMTVGKSYAICKIDEDGFYWLDDVGDKRWCLREEFDKYFTRIFNSVMPSGSNHGLVGIENELEYLGISSRAREKILKMVQQHIDKQIELQREEVLKDIKNKLGI